MSNASTKSSESPKSAKSVIPWSPWLAVIFVVLVYFASQFLAKIFISLYPALQGWSEAETLAWATRNSVAIGFLFFMLAEGLAVGAVYMFIKAQGASLKLIGLRRPRWSDLGYGVLALPAYIALYLLTVAIATQLAPGLDVGQKQQLGFQNVVGPTELTLVFLSLVIIPPLAEEIMFRGFLYSSARKLLAVIPAAVVTSLLFALAHLTGGEDGRVIFIAAIDTFILSLVLVALREITGGLWASMTLHALKNGIAFTILFILGSG